MVPAVQRDDDDDDDDDKDYTFCEWLALPFPSLRERFRLVSEAYEVFSGLGMPSPSPVRDTMREPDEFWLEQHPDELSAIIRVYRRTHDNNQHELYVQLHMFCLQLEEHLLSRQDARAQFSGFDAYCAGIERNLQELEQEYQNKSKE